jgi:hypothetical protein
MVLEDDDDDGGVGNGAHRDSADGWLNPSVVFDVSYAWAVSGEYSLFLGLELLLMKPGYLLQLQPRIRTPTTTNGNTGCC